MDGAAHGEVRLGIYSSAAAFLLLEIPRTLRGCYPGVRLVLREGPTEALDLALYDGDIDLGIAGPGGGAGGGLRPSRAGGSRRTRCRLSGSA